MGLIKVKNITKMNELEVHVLRNSALDEFRILRCFCNQDREKIESTRNFDISSNTH